MKLVDGDVPRIGPYAASVVRLVADLVAALDWGCIMTVVRALKLPYDEAEARRMATSAATAALINPVNRGVLVGLFLATRRGGAGPRLEISVEVAHQYAVLPWRKGKA